MGKCISKQTKGEKPNTQKPGNKVPMPKQKADGKNAEAGVPSAENYSSVVRDADVEEMDINELNVLGENRGKGTKQKVPLNGLQAQRP